MLLFQLFFTKLINIDYFCRLKFLVHEKNSFPFSFSFSSGKCTME